MKTINPAPNRIFAKPDEGEAKRASGLILTDNSKETPMTAVVIAVGTDVTRYKKDDRIVYKEYTTSEIRLDEQDYIIIEEVDVLGTVEEVN